MEQQHTHEKSSNDDRRTVSPEQAIGEANAVDALIVSATHAAQDAGDDGVLSLIAQVDEQLKRIREAQQTQDSGLNQLAEQFRQLEESERAVKQQQESLNKERKEIERQRDAVEKSQRELARSREQWQAEKSQHDASISERLQQAEQREQEIAARREQWEVEQREHEARVNEQLQHVQQREQELAAQQDQLNAELDRIRQRDEAIEKERAELARERDDLAQRVAQAEQRLSDAESRMTELSQQFDAACRERDTLKAKRAEQQKQLEIAGEKLREFAAALQEQNEQLEQSASALALVKQQERKIADLEARLAAGPSADDVSSGQEQIQKQAAQIREREARIESLTATIGELRKELSRITKVQDERAGATAQSDEQAEAQAAELQATRDRIAELERDLAEAKQAAEEAKANATQHLSEELRERAKRIAQATTHIRRRHRRLKRMRQLLREQSSGAAASGKRISGSKQTHEQRQRLMQEMHEIERQREQVIQARAALAAKERRMVRKWARPRAVNVMLGILVLLIANIAAAWMLANQFAPAERTASITIEPRTRPGQTMTAEDVEIWQQWHVDVVREESFIQALAKRLAERRLDGYSKPRDLAVSFRKDLTIDTGPRGRVTYTLAGRDRAAMIGMLDVLASTLVLESERRMGQRSDQAQAVVLNERRQGDSISYAMLNPWTLDDARLMWVIPFLIGTLTLTALVVWLIYVRLIRVKRLFDEATESVGDFDDPGGTYQIAI